VKIVGHARTEDVDVVHHRLFARTAIVPKTELAGLSASRIRVGERLRGCVDGQFLGVAGEELVVIGEVVVNLDVELVVGCTSRK
jgi:hypothetical protein